MRCRTCFETIASDQCHSLDEIGLNQKTLADIILEIARIDTKVNTAPEFHFLCLICADKIKSAYDFILQAQKVNQRLLGIKKNENSILDEAPIDIPFVSTWQIKSETVGLSFGSSEQNEVNLLAEVDCQLYEAVDEDLSSVPFWQSNHSPIETEDVKAEPTLEEKTETINAQANDECSDADKDPSFNDDDVQASLGSSSDDDWSKKETKPKKKKRGRPRKHEKMSKPERVTLKRAAKGSRDNICDVCGKAFIWHKDLIRHAKSHFLKPELKCDYCDRMFLRKDKLNEHLKNHSKHLFNKTHMRGTRLNELNFSKKLYEKQNLKLIQCKLCDQEFKRINELRTHLVLHKDSITITRIPASLPSRETEQGEEVVKSRICKDITENHYAEYYAIVNESGYELCLSDSDETDIDGETNALHYKCMLCDKSYNRKYKMFSHVLESHLNDKLPLECTVCKIKFVCGEMLRQHVRRQCRNKAKKFKCSNCPGRFMWEENSENHQCIKRLDEDDDNTNTTTAQKLQCDHCDKTFIWPKDLTRHIRLHDNTRERFTCTICERVFNRKDNLTVHLKVHGTEEQPKTEKSNKKETTSTKPAKIHGVDEHLKRPHGCKVIECMICQSKQMRISDLKAHLLNHQVDSSYVDRWENLEKASESLYPELGKVLSKEELVARIAIDLASKHYQRFYSIVDEFGYEVDINSSETDTDSEPDNNDDEYMRDSKKENKSFSKYICEICNAAYDRKYKMFEHQAEKHKWYEANRVCNHCGARFLNAQLLNWHYERQCKNPLKRFNCKKCPLRFMWKENLEAHMRTTHIEKTEQKTGQDAQPLKCPQCNRTFMMRKDLTRHLLMQTCRFEHGEALKCLYCARRFYRTENLSAHMLRHGVTAAEMPKAETLLKATNKPNGIKQILCRICNTTFPSISSLRSHLLKETNSALSQHYSFESPLNYVITNSLGFEMQIDDSETEDDGETNEQNSIPRPPYQCVMCNLFAKRKYQIAQHQLSMHKYEELPYKCERCIFRSVSQDILSQHMRSQCFNPDKQIECETCKFKFMWRENLETHKELHHVDKMDATTVEAHNIVTDQGLKQIFHCDQCPCKYNRKDRLTAHIKKVHSPGGIAEKKLKQQANGGNESKKEDPKYLCAFCGKYLTSSSNLVIHMRRHTGEKPFKCEFCEMAFPRSSDLLAHRRKHTGEKPHPCTICDKAFSRSYKLMLHMRTHTGERPHKCTYCDKSFSQSNDLVLHTRRHTGERPYVCGICGERFIQGTALKNHRLMRGHYETQDMPVAPSQIDNITVPVEITAPVELISPVELV